MMLLQKIFEISADFFRPDKINKLMRNVRIESKSTCIIASCCDSVNAKVIQHTAHMVQCRLVNHATFIDIGKYIW